MCNQKLNRFDSFTIGAVLIALMLGLIFGPFMPEIAIILLCVAVALAVLTLIQMLVQWLAALLHH